MSGHRLTKESQDLLHTICRLLFADLDELAALTGTARSTMHDRLERLRKMGLVTSVPHGVGPGLPKRTFRRKRQRGRQYQRMRERFYPTTKGIIKAISDLGDEDERLEFWKELPVHPQVFRRLVPRLDALAVIYSLAALIIEHTKYESATMDHFINVKDSAYDAVLRLDGGPAIGIVRIGRRQTATAFRHKWNAILREKERWPDAVLILTATGTAWRRAYEIVAATPGPPAYCAQEGDAPKAKRRVWGAPSDEEIYLISLQDLVRKLPSKQSSKQPSSPDPPSERGPARIDEYPQTLPTTSPAVRLTPAEKKLMDVIDDWHLARRIHLPGLADTSSARVSQMLASLTDQGLVTRLDLDTSKYYALSDKGLQYIAGRDRATLSLNTWSVELKGPLGRYGGQMRTLIRQLAHTRTVTKLMSDLAKEASALEDYSLTELDPPERALIRPNHVSDRTGIVLDAGGRVRYVSDDGAHWMSFVLEYEHDSVSDRRAITKVRLYQAFFGSGHKWGPGGPPLALFVLDTPDDEGRFFQVAKRLDSDVLRDIPVPFVLSNLAQIRVTGFLGSSWLLPEEDGEANRLPLTRIEPDLRRR